MSKIIAVVNQKGGTGKTATCQCLGVGLAREGKRVLLVDTDPQASLTSCMYKGDIDEIATIANVFVAAIDGEDIGEDAILHDIEGVDLVPSDISFAGMENRLTQEMAKEFFLKSYLEQFRDAYDYIIIDCSPSLGNITLNALTAADSVIIPVEPAYKSEKGLELLLRTVSIVRRKLNPKLEVDGILLNKVSRRANSTKEIIDALRDKYPVFETEIPVSVREQESGKKGISIYKYDAKGKVATAYVALTKEILRREEG